METKTSEAIYKMGAKQGRMYGFYLGVLVGGLVAAAGTSVIIAWSMS